MNKPKSKDIYCHDCKKLIKGKAMVYKTDGDVYYKCKDCYKKNKALTNFQECEVYSRIVGYLRPIKQWNPGKEQEFKDRKIFKIKKERKKC